MYQQGTLQLAFQVASTVHLTHSLDWLAASRTESQLALQFALQAHCIYKNTAQYLSPCQKQPSLQVAGYNRERARKKKICSRRKGNRISENRIQGYQKMSKYHERLT
jgi:hypothetical protein